MTNQMIPAEAVEAAADAMAPVVKKLEALILARAALEAAHPVLLAELRKAHEALERVETLAERAESHGNLYVFVDDLTSAVAAAKGDGQEKPRNSVPAPPVPGWGELKKGKGVK